MADVSPWIPTSFGPALSLSLLSTACWGTWGNTAKACAKDVAFASFYLDFSLGVWLTTVLLFLTIGGGSIYHDTATDGASHIIAAFAAGLIFNVANVLLIAGVQLAGLAVAFPVGIGTALVLGTLLTFGIDPHGNSPALLFCGVAAAFVAILLQVAADAQRQRERPPPARPLEAEAALEALDADDAHRALTSPGRPPPNGLLICAVSGLLMALWSPLSAIAMHRETDGSCDGCVTPYGSLLLLTTAVLVSSPLICKVLMARPLVGEPSSYAAYRALAPAQHLYGLVGGALWAVGTLSNLISGATLGLALSYAIGQAAPMVATLWGLLYYKEFEGAGPRTYGLVAGCMAAYAGAVWLVAASKQASNHS